MKEIYTSNHMWELFENFLVDISLVRVLQLIVNTGGPSQCTYVGSYTTAVFHI